MPLLSRFNRIARPLALAALAAAPASAHSSGVTFRHVRRAGIRANVITVNLNDRSVKVSVALSRRGVGSRESFGSLVHRVQPAAAVTGTYFGLRDAQPVGDIVIGGRLVHTGFVGTALAITAENRARFIATRRWRSRDWSDYETVICGGPRLVTNGRAFVVPRAEGFRDRSLFRRRPRTAVGLTRSNRLVLVTVARPIYLRQLARVMRSLGCRNAIALDGGNSSAMFYRGQVAARPRRSLTNLLVVYDSSIAYHHALGRLAPGITLARRPAHHLWAVAGSRTTTDSRTGSEIDGDGPERSSASSTTNSPDSGE
jgi:exopolysaccharide biosynthesis protein